MKHITLGWILPAATAALGACAITPNPPLLFGDQTTYGLQLGSDAASTGGSVSLGYKARSLAIVPLSVLNKNGLAGRIRSGAGEHDIDALSVFAVFDSSAGGTDGTERVRLGQVFATGVAAQQLTHGFACRAAKGQPECDTARATASRPATTANRTPPPTLAAIEAALRRVIDEQRPPLSDDDRASGDRPYQSPLVFLRTDLLGIDIGGSIAEQGLRFSLGYDNNNLARIPPTARSAGGAMSTLYGTDERGHSDVYSVLGQFNSSSSTRGLDLGLERYFATGLAARNLARGLAAAVAAQPASAPASTVAPASAPTR